MAALRDNGRNTNLGLQKRALRGVDDLTFGVRVQAFIHPRCL